MLRPVLPRLEQHAVRARRKLPDMTRLSSRALAAIAALGVAAGVILTAAPASAQEPAADAPKPAPTAEAPAGESPTTTDAAESERGPENFVVEPDTDTGEAASETTDGTTGPNAATAGEARASGSDDLEAALGTEAGFSDSDLPGQDTSSLSFYGFADFSYFKLLVSHDNAWAGSYPGDGSFFIGNLNLYMGSELGAVDLPCRRQRFSISA